LEASKAKQLPSHEQGDFETLNGTENTVGVLEAFGQSKSIQK
jgi:hypothetical protein